MAKATVAITQHEILIQFVKPVHHMCRVRDVCLAFRFCDTLRWRNEDTM